MLFKKEDIHKLYTVKGISFKSVKSMFPCNKLRMISLIQIHSFSILAVFNDDGTYVVS